MIGTDSNHCRIVAEGLAADRGMNEQTLASLAILDERLERLKKLDEAFADVTFSRAVEQLRSQSGVIAVG